MEGMGKIIELFLKASGWEREWAAGKIEFLKLKIPLLGRVASEHIFFSRCIYKYPGILQARAYTGNGT